MTHYFSPRIYITDTVSPDRATYLTNWVKDRLKEGDDIGLHLHMFYDFVQGSGVEPKHEPNWGDKGDGYGVPTSAYSKDELKSIIQKALELMEVNGFSNINKYRAGGWFANLETLSALDELGIKIDSSGRTSYRFGSNNLPGYWDLTPTTGPYKPSRTNQNKTSLSNSFSLLEIPDNGADSYWFSADDMINRFKANFSGALLNEKRQITYLSHPHWFNTAEQERIKTVFSHINNYAYEHDAGPVIFTTTEGIYQAWMKE